MDPSGHFGQTVISTGKFQSPSKPTSRFFQWAGFQSPSSQCWDTPAVLGLMSQSVLIVNSHETQRTCLNTVLWGWTNLSLAFTYNSPCSYKGDSSLYIPARKMQMMPNLKMYFVLPHVGKLVSIIYFFPFYIFPHPHSHSVLFLVPFSLSHSPFLFPPCPTFKNMLPLSSLEFASFKFILKYFVLLL